ncbi:MAG: hypothetical protein Q8N60_05415, partial [Candidatus Diapherotrites archaeon]|nr:hypothetical protein [Candidatus Diapherotrites archaeon]
CKPKGLRGLVKLRFTRCEKMPYGRVLVNPERQRRLRRCNLSFSQGFLQQQKGLLQSFITGLKCLGVLAAAA